MDMDIIVQRCSKPVVKVVSPTNLSGSWRTIAVGLLLVALVIEFASTMRLTRREYLWVEQNTWLQSQHDIPSSQKELLRTVAH
jgi:hypothetical protein